MASPEGNNNFINRKFSPSPGLRSFADTVTGSIRKKVDRSRKPTVEYPIPLDELVGQSFEFQLGRVSGQAVFTGITIVPNKQVNVEGEVAGLAGFKVSIGENDSQLAVTHSLTPRTGNGLRRDIATITGVSLISGIVPIFLANPASRINDQISPHTIQGVRIGKGEVVLKIKKGLTRVID